MNNLMPLLITGLIAYALYLWGQNQAAQTAAQEQTNQTNALSGAGSSFLDGLGNILGTDLS
jgi:hypothetical protein